MNRRLRKTLVLIFALMLTIALGRSIVSPVRALADEGEPYRVEIVHNDPYKVQDALNSLTRQGWNYVSSISRSDAKVLLVFRRAGS